MNQYYNVTQAADALGVSRPTIYKMMERGELDYIRITTNVTRIKRDSVTRILEGGNNESNSIDA